MASPLSLDSLRKVPFIRDVAWVDGGITLRTGAGAVHRLSATQCSRTALRDLLRNGEKPAFQLALLAGSVDNALAEQLRAAGVSYLDEAGNCAVTIDDRLGIYIEGKKLPEPESEPTGMRSAGYRALFAMLVKPDLVNASLRTIAEEAGVSTTTASAVLTTLRAEGSIGTVKGKSRLRIAEGLVDRWLVGYRDVVRPWLFIGRYETPPGGRATLARLLQGRFADGWRWGGALADEALGGHLHDAPTTVHLNVWLRKDFPRMPLRQSPDGDVLVLGVPGPLAMPAGATTVHRLLVYTELRIDPDARSREAAAALLERGSILGEP